MINANYLITPEVKGMASLSLSLLKIGEEQNISALLGYSPSLSNKAAVSCWIADYIEAHPDKTNFIDEIMPELWKQLCKYEVGDWC